MQARGSGGEDLLFRIIRPHSYCRNSTDDEAFRLSGSYPGKGTCFNKKYKYKTKKATGKEWWTAVSQYFSFFFCALKLRIQRTFKNLRV